MTAAKSSVAALLLACVPALAAAGTDQDEIQRNAFATHRSGVWSATAAFFSKDYTFGPEYQCRMSTPGAELLQIRGRESNDMRSFWMFSKMEAQRPQTISDIRTISINGKRFKVAALPWRLAVPSAHGIILSIDKTILVARRREDQPWLPLVYLTSEMLTAKSFELEYVDAAENLSDDAHEQPKRTYRNRISLDGFNEVSRWCGRQLLQDRVDEARVQALTR